MSDDEADISLGSVFTEPSRPPTPEPKLALYSRERRVPGEWQEIRIRLVGAHPLWGHHLWNAARAFAAYLDEYQDIYKNRCVLELGAGGALPSIVAAKNGAKKAVVTDYPDHDLVKNMIYNVEDNIRGTHKDCVSVQGYIWGRSVVPLLEAISQPGSGSDGFDVIILSDLIFNHSQHDAILTTCEQALSPKSNDYTPSLLVFYSHHIPSAADRDMQFFEKAKERGWLCEEILTRTFPPMFPDDTGDEITRSTVHGWRMIRS